MNNELRTYRLFAIDRTLPSGRCYPKAVIEKAIAECIRPFYVVYDINSFNIQTNEPLYEFVCGEVDMLWIENSYLYVRFKTTMCLGKPDIWNREPNSLSILPIAVGTTQDNENIINNMKMYCIAIAKNNNNQFSKFIKRSRILRDVFIPVTR